MNLFEEQMLVDVCSYLRSGKTITASEISTHGEYPVFGGNGCRGLRHTTIFQVTVPLLADKELFAAM